jgi:hypothetical protein
MFDRRAPRLAAPAMARSARASLRCADMHAAWTPDGIGLLFLITKAGLWFQPLRTPCSSD